MKRCILMIFVLGFGRLAGAQSDFDPDVQVAAAPFAAGELTPRTDAGPDFTLSPDKTAQAAGATAPPSLSRKISSRNSLRLSPVGDLFPRGIADPRRPTNSLIFMGMTHREIDGASGTRLGTVLGGTRGLFRIHPHNRPDQGFQLQVGAAFFAQWDAENSMDGLGWDGMWHILGTWTSGPKVAFEFGYNHKSSHVMDEYMENTGRGRLGYTREEVLAGVSFKPARHWRTYGELGYGFRSGNENQEPLRLQAGIEYESERRMHKGLTGWYLALDAQVHEEDAWNLSAAIQLGWVMPVKQLGRTYRLGLEYYRGRSPLGEFFQDDEDHIAIGWWFDL